MKMIVLICGLLVVASCADKSKEVTAEVTKSDAVSEESLDIFKDSPIPVYDFDKLEAVLLNQKNDTTYVVNFWATWCKPCINELPFFEQLGSTYADKKVKVVLVSLDFPEYLHTKVVPFIEKYQLVSEVILLADDDANTWIPKVSKEWEGSIPATVIFNGENRSFYERSFTYKELEKEVQSNL